MLNKVITWGLVDIEKGKVITTHKTRSKARESKRWNKSLGKEYKIVRFQAQQIVR